LSTLYERARWTVALLASELVRLTEHASVCRETVRRRLAENDLKPWRKDLWCIPQVDAEYLARMEDVLDLYAEVPDPKHPVVCFHESPIPLIGEVREPIPAKQGQFERYDCDHKRNGTAWLHLIGAERQRLGACKRRSRPEPALGNVHLAPGPMDVEEDEQVGAWSPASRLLRHLISHIVAAGGALRRIHARHVVGRPFVPLAEI
jgi:hypothetical protein